MSLFYQIKSKFLHKFKATVKIITHCTMPYQVEEKNVICIAPNAITWVANAESIVDT